MTVWRFKKSQQGLVGVDITSATVKLIELDRAGVGQRIASYAVRPLREGAVVERRIRDLDEVAATLTRAVEHARPHSRRAVAAVPASATITKTLTYPVTLSDDEIEARIQLESERHIPFPLNEVAFDFQRLGLNARYPDQQDVLLVACRLQDVDHLADVLRRAGLEPAAVDVESFAMERAASKLLRDETTSGQVGECAALVDIGANMNAFHVLIDGRIAYTRDNVLGGRHLTEEIRKRYGLSLEEAGLAKKRGGLPEDYEHEVLLPFIDMLIQQVGRSLQLYHTSGKPRDIQRLILAGGSSVIPGLRERLEAQSGLEVVMANPFERMRVASRVDVQALASDAPAMLTACGLAMRGRR
ncbi:type IV pilus assembly protein PilM [Chromohalobacter sp. HP20-39]|uniref:type IV pilus assembly protein PilM n=1 Tax=Chromohalobacter sp. HP20-39 TaxID=3079306 RepID=UPI00294B7BB6|nr:type IV pilus assembly protein PilM [Chromohalobacter sp. HP20-39]MDV6320317.1 type IV pilus assembly protein PilM [Chromohalobacter sp. HP20-39]